MDASKPSAVAVGCTETCIAQKSRFDFASEVKHGVDQGAEGCDLLVRPQHSPEGAAGPGVQLKCSLADGKCSLKHRTCQASYLDKIIAGSTFPSRVQVSDVEDATNILGEHWIMLGFPFAWCPSALEAISTSIFCMPLFDGASPNSP